MKGFGGMYFSPSQAAGVTILALLYVISQMKRAGVGRRHIEGGMLLQREKSWVLFWKSEGITCFLGAARVMRRSM